MEEFLLCTPCLFGLEGLVGDELKRLNMRDVAVENGRVLFKGNASDIAKANVCLRMAERVLIIVGEFSVFTFDELFEGTKSLPWENFIPTGDAFPVKGHSLNSKLTSIPDCQKIIKKAVVERLKSKFGGSWLKEDGAKHQIQFAIMKDHATLYIDTSGAGLHKRGYRAIGNAAPLRETLAAALVTLSRYRGREPFCDPLCGSGTIAIEAAMIAKNRAPGLLRRFDGERWSMLPRNLWEAARSEARDREFNGNYDISGSDNDPKAIEIAKSNALKAGIAPLVRFSVADAVDLRRSDSGGILISNPPYGERLMEQKEAGELYRKLGVSFSALDNWKIYIISSHPEFESYYGKKATKKRKLYNGMIKCDLFMYL